MPWRASLLAKHKRTGGAQMAMLVDHEMVLLMLVPHRVLWEMLGEDFERDRDECQR
jgi:hypothetical protein